MTQISQRLQQVRQRIAIAASRYQRSPDSIRLLAVSKTQPVAAIAEAVAAGQQDFGESYLQEALDKIRVLSDHAICWHYIGRIQSNKTRPIAEHFDWVHSVDQEKQLQRLNAQRPEDRSPLNVCLQIKIDNELSKGGLEIKSAEQLVRKFSSFPRLQLRGLMTLPAPAADFEEQRQAFRLLHQLRNQLATPNLPLDTLSMGMSDDMEAAIAEGSTLVRIGSAIFGPRNPKN